MDQNARQQIIDRLKEANNVLITVSANPSVDQLAACIGITLVLNHLGKHATAVFSGEIPSTIEFLKPEATIEKNTDSLRDFIIALDKSKADKLRYKVEDKIVKIFITPYRTSLSDKDLDFSQGDFNVDAVLALGVHERTDLDKAIVAHGRILHDATVISVNNKDQGNLGAINWVDLNASSLSEMLALLTKGLSAEAIDGQMATAFMTGIVAETARFSNTKTSPQTMSLAAELMTAGANQQLIASKLDEAKSNPKAAAKEGESAEDVDDGTGLLEISHNEAEETTETKTEPTTEAEEKPEEPKKVDKPAELPAEPEVDKKEEKDSLLGATPDSMINPPIMTHASSIGPAADRTPSPAPTTSSQRPAGSMTWEPPSLGGQLTANSQPEHMQNEPSTDPLSLPSVSNPTANPPLLNRSTNLPGTPATPNTAVDTGNKSLTDIEASVGSAHLDQDASAEEPKEEILEDAREAVDDAIAAEPPSRPLNPIQGLGAQPVDLNLGNTPPPALVEPAPAAPTPPPVPPANTPTTPAPPDPFTPTPVPATPNPFGAPPDLNGVNPNVPESLLPPSQPVDNTAAGASPTAPPPVPPPFNPAP